MIKAVLWKAPTGMLWGYDISGHAEYADPGMDIICSAVSVLAINTANSLDSFTKLSPSVTESDGHLTVEIKDLAVSDSSDLDKAQLLLKSLKLGLDSIQASYGSQYLQVKTIQK